MILTREQRTAIQDYGYQIKRGVARDSEAQEKREVKSVRDLVRVLLALQIDDDEAKELLPW